MDGNARHGPAIWARQQTDLSPTAFPMYRRLRTFIWFALIASGVVIVLLTFINASDAAAVLAGAGVILVWVVWGIFSSWLFGLRRLMASHLRGPIDKMTFVSKDVGSSRIADYVRTLEAIRESTDSPWHGIDRYSVLSTLKTSDLAREPIDWNTVEAEDERLINIPSNAVYFLRREGKPFVVRMSVEKRTEVYQHEDAWTTGPGEQLELCAESLEEANAIIRWLSAQTNLHSIYRGQLIQVASPQDGSSGQTIRIGDRPTAERDSIVLPDHLPALLERLVNSREQHAKHLSELGHHSKLGILLHGPPGTGKTLLTRYLIGSNRKYTIIIPSDMEVETLRESFRLAKYLQPSMLIIEDVDLLAPRRETGSRVDGLQELMNEMDGLTSAANTIVIMSTNRPDVLEPALASRPGRVSQALEIPLPDTEMRAELLRRFLDGATSGQKLIEEWATRTEGASPAFLEELSKRAILLASERADLDSSGRPDIDVQYGDLENAIHELVVLGGEMTTRALGFPG